MTGFKGPSRRSKDDSEDECHTCGPPYIFKHKPTEHLFQDYSFHIRRVTVSSLLGIYILLTAVLAILYFAYQRRPSEKNIYHISLCALGITLYIYINTKYLRTRRQLKIVSYLVWILLLLFAFISFPLGEWINGQMDTSAINPAEGVWQLLFIIYCMYLLLPVNFFMTVVFGIVLSLVHSAVVMIRLQDLPQIKNNWAQIMVNAVLFIVVNAVGIMAHHISEKTQRESFVNCRAYIGAKLESQEQGLKLVKVAETCLPKFMCNEVCADLTMYNNIVCPRQVFAKSYDCVSIACITISGLEKLRSQTDSTDYVNIINDLTQTFESLCECYNCLAVDVLGESFVAVSGIPVTDPEGARSCVSLCFDMIQAVHLVQSNKGVGIEALTGVHYGSVTTGVVGTYRWQYKCSGNDLLLAKHVALTGSTGRVHITEPCIRYLALDSYEIQQSNVSHGITIPTYYIHPYQVSRKVSPAVMKLSRRLAKNESVASFMRLESMENDDPFFVNLFKTTDNRPSMTTCLLEGKAFVHRLAHHENADSDVTNKAFRQAVKIGSVEHETSDQMSFFTLRFNDKFMESSFIKESNGFGLTLTFVLILLIALAVLHFTLLPRTMLLLASVLFLFILLSLLCISIIASKLRVVRCRCLSQHTNKLALTVIIIIVLSLTTLVNLLTCQSSTFYSDLPLALRYAILGSDVSHTACASPYSMLLSGVLVLFIISVTRISHIVQTLLIVPIAAAYAVIIAYTHQPLFTAHDLVYGTDLPPSSVMAIVALLHFALLHVLVGRHSEWVRRLNFIWRHKEMSSYQNAQDMITLRLGVADNTLPSHVMPHYTTPECVMKPYSMSHNLVGVAFLTVPNFPGFINEMHRSNQPLTLIQVLHDVTSAFDHLLRRGDFHVIEKVYDDGLTYVLVSGINQAQVPFIQPGMEHEYLIHHLCKLLDLLLDMKHCLLQLNAMSGRNLVLRAGVSMGSVIEGVCGYKRPQYNIWGHAVDMARKLELTGKMNNIQVNKEVAQILKRRFQFQPRAQANMPVLQELQPYVVMGRRLQSVIASDNESVNSGEINYPGPRSPRLHNHSMGSISQADTVIVSNQQQHLLSASNSSRVRTASFEIGTGHSGMVYPNNSGNTTPSDSFTRNLSRESGFVEGGANHGITPGWKLPQTPSLTKLQMPSSRAMSPELPAVHYSKNRTPPVARMATSDSRGTIILTQANLTGSPVPNHAQTNSPQTEFIHPSAANLQSSQPKLANVVYTDSVRSSPRKQLSPVGELAMMRDSHAHQSISSIHSSQGRTTPMSPHLQHQGRVTPISVPSPGGRMTPQSSSSSSHRGSKVTPDGFVYPAPPSPASQQARMSPAMSYTRSTPPLRLPSRTSSQSSSHRDSPRVRRSETGSNSDQLMEDETQHDYKDTVPLLGGHDVSSRPYRQQSNDRTQAIPHVDRKNKPPVILGLDRVMTTSMYSDKMQTSMEGNVSTSSSSPDDDAPLFSSGHKSTTNKELSNINNDPSLSPLLKHQLNRFAKKRENSHKSPHLSRKFSSQGSGSPRLGRANTICSLSPPTTPLDSPVSHTGTDQTDTPTNTLTNKPVAHTNNVTDGEADESGNNSPDVSPTKTIVSQDGRSSRNGDVHNHAHNGQQQWSGARPKQHLNNIGNGGGPPLPNPPPPVESCTESELSEISDDDNEHVGRGYDLSATDYDNMYSTDYGTYEKNSHLLMPSKYTKDKEKITPIAASHKFMVKLEKMQASDRSIRELYSEIESDAADCESLVGDTDYETEPIGAPPMNSDYSHPLQKLQWTENRLLALLRPSSGAAPSTMGSSLRHCRSMELLPSENEATMDMPRNKKRLSHRKINAIRNSQQFDDNMSITSSMLGSEYSRSDPNLSDIGAYESEYDNYIPGGLLSDDDFFSNKPITDIHVDLSQFGNIDFDKIKINENMTTQDYIQNLQRHIENRQKGASVVTDV